MTALEHVVIVGVSAAGIAAAQALRAQGYPGRLTLVGAERHPPYDRPPLSKQILTGAWEPDRIALLDGAEAYAGLDAEFRLGTRATGLDLAARKLHVDESPALGYDAVLIATGVHPRRLPGGHELAGVHLLRTLDDALTLRAALREAARVVVIGAGFLGTEVAAAARALDRSVTLVDPLPTPVQRQLGRAVGALVGRLHEERGVRVRTGTEVERLVGSDGRVTGVALRGGRVLDADLVLVAIGSSPATDWLAGSGLALAPDGAIPCDEYCQAGPGVYAAGDVASWPDPNPDPAPGARVRLEHRMNATEQAVCAARNLLGGGERYAPVPYFWTNQYDCLLQVHGIIPTGAEPALLAGHPRDGGFVALYRSRGRVASALGWNRPGPLRAAHRLVAERAAWDEVAGLRAFPGTPGGATD